MASWSSRRSCSEKITNIFSGKQVSGWCAQHLTALDPVSPWFSREAQEAPVCRLQLDVQHPRPRNPPPQTHPAHGAYIHLSVDHQVKLGIVKSSTHTITRNRYQSIVWKQVSSISANLLAPHTNCLNSFPLVGNIEHSTTRPCETETVSSPRLLLWWTPTSKSQEYFFTIAFTSYAVYDYVDMEPRDQPFW